MKFILSNFWCLVLVLVGAVVCGLSIDLKAADGNTRFWSFQPVRSVIPPAVQAQDWCQSPIDRFILAKLEEHQLSPSPSADRRTMIRRATFDLIGLPPTPDEINAFLQDDSPEAFAHVVDRLLASPQYGERWGRHWLDVVRYADARDLIQLPAESDFREAWRYRDWVVASLNRDLPYDQFIRLQVAGDLMQPSDPNQIDAEALVATGMLAIADFVPGDVDKQQMIADYVNDQIDVVGRAILGLTLACARCHDHKFDPISTDEYYSLAGIFFSTRLVPGPIAGNTPLVKVPLLPQSEIAIIEATQARDKSRIGELSREISIWADREYRAYLERQVTTESQRYLLAAWEFVHPPSGQERSALGDFSASRGLDPATLSRWVVYFEAKRPQAALSPICRAIDRVEAEQQSHQLAAKLSELSAERRMNATRDPASRSHGETANLQFRADDQRTVLNDSQHVTLWPNRGRAFANATPVANTPAPVIKSVTLNGQSRSILHFSGNDLLQVPGTIPAVGSLFVMFRPDPAGPSGQRLVGWEDAAVGQHGLGIMTDAAGSVHAILRRNGANGDVVVPAPSPLPEKSGFQILCITWGPDGVTVYRDGQSVGNNKTLNSVSSDPTITALRIGGAGSGLSPQFHGDIAELRIYGMPLEEPARSRVEAEITQRWFSSSEAAKSLDPVADLYEELASAQSPFLLEPAARERALSDESRQQFASLRTELETLQKKTPPEIPRAVVVQDGGPKGTPHEGFHDASVYLRGNHKNPGQTVPRGFPKAVSGATSFPILDGSGRRELARWLTAPENPLTARVMVNRMWQHHFGVGLVRTSANFGEMGERPSHPELLDHLAARFVASGWSVKAMHRTIMLSSVYQQSSTSSAQGLAIDPENRWLWRANRRRLEAEAVRDNLFAVAGRLDPTPGGPGFQNVATPRRSLYLMAVRTGAKTAEFGPLFDAPDCSGIVERRNESIVAPQALFMMNDPLVGELASLLGDRVTRPGIAGLSAPLEVTVSAATTRKQQTNSEPDVDAHKPAVPVDRLYEIALGRLPTDNEIEIGLQLCADPNLVNAWNGYSRLIICTNEFLFVD